jgi:hypothetical protein
LFTYFLLKGLSGAVEKSNDGSVLLSALADYVKDQVPLFEPKALIMQKNREEILFSDIAEVSKRNTMGFIANGVLIRSKAGVEYKFVVLGRDKLISIIQSRLGETA